MRLAPGFDVDERQLDSRLSAQTLEAMRAERLGQNKSLPAFYASYLRNALHGDFGRSQMYSRPVRQLIAESAPETLRTAGFGLLFGWSGAFLLATLLSVARFRGFDAAGTMLAAVLLAIPAAVIALFFVYASAPASLAIALIVFPRIYRYLRNLLSSASEMPHVLMATARGVGPGRIFFWHVLPPAGRQLLALAGVSVSIAIGAAIPVEALCGIPGLGKLAWQSALGRDLPLLMTVTVLVTVATMFANSAADIASEALHLPKG